MPIRGRDFPVPDVALSDFLWEKCRKGGKKIAMVDNACDRNSLTFEEIYEKSRNCAAFLYQEGARKGDFIGLCAPSSPQFSIALLGILGCGATVAPCNPAYKKGEILQQFTISEPKMVIVDETALETLKNVQAELPCLQKIFVLGNSDEFTTLDSMSKAKGDMGFLENMKINPTDDIAMLTYSSGTTGLPKSVMRTHRNFVAFIVLFINHTEWRNWEKYVLYTDRPMYHGGGFFCVFLTLASGMKLIIEKEFEVELMLKSIEMHKVTHLMTVPPILIQLANAEGAEKYDTSSLISIMGVGSSMAPDILRRAGEKFNVTLAPAYGMTEASVISLNLDAKNYSSSAGVLLPTVELKITDIANSEECATGQNGEICVRGPQVMKGYLRNLEATAKAIDNEGWLHTGDIGHLDQDERLYVVGRLKEVIKYKGVQVPPAELESVVLKHPKVADVGVIGIPDPLDGELPKAFIVKKDASLTEQEINDFVKTQLVDYKQLRGGIEFVDAIPKSTTGKIQRNELKKIAGIVV